MSFWQSGWRWIACLPVLVWLDQWSKWWLLHNIPWGESHAVTSWLSITHVHNYGVAFSLFNDPRAQVWIFLCLACAVVVALGVWLKRLPAKPKGLPLSIVCLMSGALGNILDRLQHGFVVDFIDVHWRAWHWPAFNIADALVCMGVVGVLWFSRLRAR